jgi:precorrin-2 dehydrogenase/sirohydrochlorin ferrochelatase
MTEGYPITLNLEGKVCVIVGGGVVAARKVTGLLEAAASVIVISPVAAPAFQAWIDQQQIQWIQQPYSPGLLPRYQPALVFAATNQPQINQQIAAEARSLPALVNIVDDITGSDFINMATIRRPPLTIAMNTGGASPALSRHLRAMLEKTIGDEYALLAHWMGELRPRAMHQIEAQADRQQLYDTVLQSDILTLLRQQQITRAREQFDTLVREWGSGS